MAFVVAFVPGVTPGKWERIWRERVPRVPLELRPSSADHALTALRDGTAQMALLRDTDADDEFHAIPLYRERPVVVASRDHLLAALDAHEEVALADLADDTLLGPPEHDPLSADTVALVTAGVGVAIMPQSVARAHSRRDVVARVVAGAPDTGISLVWRADRPGELVDTFVGIVRGRTANSSR
ncbi:MAG: LysR family substrate-binding domain-containing protein [Actinomycetales bacterium]|nr:LysR family substrate-binding domain-containing protein [Actinomycetales bacterium]